MEIEHLTLGGNSVIRNSDSIVREVKRHFSTIDIKYESKLYTIPEIPFKIKITVASEGAIFDLQSNGRPAITNVCCFQEEDTELMMNHVNSMNLYLSFLFKNPPIKPTKGQWIYSVIISPFLPPNDVMLAGEIELYIYERIYQAWKKAR